MRRTPPVRFPYWVRVAVIGIALDALVCTQTARAAMIGWNGGAGNFSGARNWSGGVPGAGDDAVVNSGGVDTVTVDPAVAGLRSLGTGPNSAVNVLAGNQLTIGTGNAGLVLDNAGALNLSAGGLVGGRVTVDQSAGGGASNN